MAQTKLSAIFPWKGGKKKISKWIMSFFPPHKRYVEPFVGAAAIFLNKNPSTEEVINDLNPGIANLYRLVQRDPYSVLNIMAMIPFERRTFIRYKNLKTEDPMEQVARHLVLTKMSFSGACNSIGIVTGNSSYQTSKAMTWLRAQDEEYFKELNKRLAGVDITNEDGIQAVLKYDDPNTLIYADPPYLNSVKTNGQTYEFDMDDDDIHGKLLKNLNKVKSSVILSGYYNDYYNSLLKPADGWNVYTREHSVSIHGDKSKNTRTVIEAIWVKLSK